MKLFSKSLKSTSHLLLLLASTLFIFQGSRCKPEPKPMDKVYLGPYYIDSIRNYFAFAPGSWWIYENDKTGELDTVQVQNTGITIRTLEGKGPLNKWYIHTFEDFYTELHSSRQGFVSYGLADPCIYCTGYPDDTVVRTIIKNHSVSVRFQFKPKDFKWDKFYKTFNLGNQSYNDVSGFYNASGSYLPPWDRLKYSQSPQASIHYFSPGNGLIKLQTIGTQLDTMSWNLIQHHVIPY